MHLWHLGFPTVHDAAYIADGAVGDTRTSTAEASPLRSHAHRIAFLHPLTKQRVTCEADPLGGHRPDACSSSLVVAAQCPAQSVVCASLGWSRFRAHRRRASAATCFEIDFLP